MPDLRAVVVGSGPNGLVAAATLARRGWSVTVLEAQATAGGGTRSLPLTEPGFVHDVCSAVHPLAVASPVLAELPLADHGLEWVHPARPVAHPLDGGRAVVLERSVAATAAALGPDGRAWRRLLGPLTGAGPGFAADLVGLRPRAGHLVALARFARVGVRSVAGLAHQRFAGEEAAALLAGCAAHAALPLDAPVTAGYGLLLAALGHTVGWPVARGGSQAIADALVGVVGRHGGTVVTGTPVASLADVPPADAVLLDVTPRQLLAMAGGLLPAGYARRLARYRYGPAVWKVDWALDGPIPWSAPACADAGTVHLGGTVAELAASEWAVHAGRPPDRPFVLLVQPTVCDPTRAPVGRHVAWAYCHLPAGAGADMTARVEAQVERFAPGFRDRVVGRHVLGPAGLEAADANHVDGEITGGATDWRQLLARPVPSPVPWATPLPGVYLCSSSTPPGPGVHGGCGWWAATVADRRARRSARPPRWAGAGRSAVGA